MCLWSFVSKATTRTGSAEEDSGLNIIPGESLVDAVEKAVAAAGG